MQKIRALLWRFKTYLWAGIALGAFLCVLQAVESTRPVMEQSLVYTRDVYPGDVLAQSDVELREVPKNFVPAENVADNAQVTGKTLATFGASGSPVSIKHLLDEDFYSRTPPGYVVMPIKISDQVMADMLSSGMKVSVFHTGQTGSELMAEDVLVVGKNTSATHNASGNKASRDILGGENFQPVVYVAFPQDTASTIVSSIVAGEIQVVPYVGFDGKV